MVTPPAKQLRDLFEKSYLTSKSPGTRARYLESLQRLEAWAKRETLDLGHLQTADLTRFLAEQARQYSSSSVKVCRAALRAFYQCLHNAGVIDDNPADRLRHIPVGHRASSQPIADLTDENIAHIRATAQELGPLYSLVVCLLHETPITIAGIARLSPADLAEDCKGNAFLILGRTTASRTPWSISSQARAAIAALQTDQHPLVSPTTKKPNHLLRAALEQTRKRADIQTSDLAAALAGTQRREEQELCERLRLARGSYAAYRRTLLPGLRPLATT